MEKGETTVIEVLYVEISIPLYPRYALSNRYNRSFIISKKLELGNCQNYIRTRKSYYRLKNNMKINIKIQLNVMEHKLNKSLNNAEQNTRGQK